MKLIFLYFWQLCLLKTSPERLPSTRELFFLILVIYFPVSIVATGISRPDLDVAQALGLVLTNFLIGTTCIWLLLSFKKVENRYITTLIAIFGCSILLTLVALPLNMLFYSMENYNQDSTSIVASLALMILFWWFAIAGNILSHAGNISFFLGFALALTMEILYVVAVRSLFPSLNTS